jgi:hypothetical protein
MIASGGTARRQVLGRFQLAWQPPDVQVAVKDFEEGNVPQYRAVLPYVTRHRKEYQVNVISELFTNPQTPTDRQNIDLLETHVSSELVEAIRNAKTRQESCARIEELVERLEDAEGLTDSQVESLSDWLDCVITEIRPESEKIGPQFS